MKMMSTLTETSLFKTLEDQCLKTLSRNLLNQFQNGNIEQLKALVDSASHSRLPSKIIEEKLLPHFVHDAEFLLLIPKQFNSFIVTIFKRVSKTRPLNTIKLHNAIHLTNKTLSILLAANPLVKHLDIRGCSTLTMDCISSINKASKLESLQISHLQPGKLLFCKRVTLMPKFWHQQLKCTHLETLVIQLQLRPDNGVINKMFPSWNAQYMDHFLEPVISNLKYLDFCDWTGHQSLSVLKKATHLETLILYHPHRIWMNNFVEDIVSLKTLKILSLVTTINGDSNTLFDGLLSNMVKIFNNSSSLEHLDISAANIHGKSFSHSIVRDKDATEIKSAKVTMHSDLDNFTSELMILLDRPSEIFRIFPELVKEADMGRGDLKLKLVNFICRLLKDPNLHPSIKDMSLKCFQMLLDNTEEGSSNLELHAKEELLEGLFFTIRHYNYDFNVISRAYGILQRFNLPSDIAFNFVDLAETILNIRDIQPMDLQTYANICRIRELLTRGNRVDYAETLFNLKIIQKSVKFLEILHLRPEGNGSYRTDIRDIVFVLFKTISNIVKLVPNASRLFVNLKGLNWMNGFLTRFPELHTLFEEMIRNVGEIRDLFEFSSSKELLLSRKEKRRLRKNEKCLKAVQNLLQIKGKDIYLSRRSLCGVSPNNNGNQKGDSSMYNLKKIRNNL